MLLSLLLGLIWLSIALWFTSPYWVPALVERVGHANGFSLKLKQVSRPTLDGLRVGQLMLVNESLVLTVDDLSVSWTHPNSPNSRPPYTLLQRMLTLPSMARDPESDLLLIAVQATRVDLQSGRRLPMMLVPQDSTPASSEDRQAPVPERSGRKLAKLFEALGPEHTVYAQPPGFIPEIDLPFGLQIDATVKFDHLQVSANTGEAARDSDVSEQLGFVSKAFSAHVGGLGHRPMFLALATAGVLSLPSVWREYGKGHDTAQDGALSFSLDPQFPLRMEASIDQEAMRLDIHSSPLQAALSLGPDAADNAAWRLRGNLALSTAGLAPEFLLPAIGPVFMQPLPLRINEAAMELDADMWLDDSLLPHPIQPERAHLSADVTLDVSGPPGRLRFAQTLQLDREADGLKLDTSPGVYRLEPIAAWWQNNAWFQSTGLQSTVLQPWRVEQGAVNCSVERWQLAGSSLPDCNWPLGLSVEASQNSLALQLTPGAGPKGNASSADSFALPSSLILSLASSGQQLHELLPKRWSLNGGVEVLRPLTTSATDVWQIDLNDLALSFSNLERPEGSIDRLNLKIPQLHLRLPQQRAADGTFVLKAESIAGSGVAELDMQVRSEHLPVSEPVPITASFALETLKPTRAGSPDILLDVKALELAGLKLTARLRAVPEDRSAEGTLRLSGQPDRTLLNAALVDAVGELVPGLDVTPGTLLFKGAVGLDLSRPQPRWSAEGLLGLQQWQVITEKAEARRLTVSASLAASEQRVQVFSEGEALSTVSADLTLLGLPFPAAFVKLTTDLLYGPGRPPGSDAGIVGSVTLTKARIGAFLGEASLADSVTLPLPLSRVSEADPLHVPLHLRGIDLGALVALENEHIDASGTISGRLGLVYTGSSVQIPASAPGQLTADGGGRIQLKEAGQWQSMAGGNPQLLFAVGALGNFQYDSLKTSVIFDDDEWLKLDLELRGRNPEVMEARPIHYNLNVETNILSLLQSLEMTKNLSETLEQRLLKAYE
ncbi:intermembrane phospholipid transport protein YdbH family protein [Allohahella marinimesophila]|uniref:Dicarboxylate transport n=1 Tax=Allohahella marinimesophila TaxID=1054972 RepID=A0ABP7PCC1_9GAMM